MSEIGDIDREIKKVVDDVLYGNPNDYGKNVERIRNLMDKRIYLLRPKRFDKMKAMLR